MLWVFIPVMSSVLHEELCNCSPHQQSRFYTRYNDWHNLDHLLGILQWIYGQQLLKKYNWYIQDGHILVKLVTKGPIMIMSNGQLIFIIIIAKTPFVLYYDLRENVFSLVGCWDLLDMYIVHKNKISLYTKIFVNF